MSESEVKWIPVRTAAKMLGCSRQRVWKLCHEGALSSMVMDSTRLVSRRSVEDRLGNRFGRSGDDGTDR